MSLNNLLENLIKRGQTTGFDFSKSPESNMFPYEDDTNIHNFDTGESIPIAPVKQKWETVHKRDFHFITRTFRFKSMKHLLYFVNESLKAAENANHHPILKIDHLRVETVLYTKDYNDITESDLTMAKYMDELFEDIGYIRSV